MWTDERGSEVLDLPECRRLLAVGVKGRRHGHLAIGQPDDRAPLLLPVDYAVDWPDVVVQVGEGLFRHMVGRLVSFEVDGTDRPGLPPADHERPWSVVVQGLAIEEDARSVHWNLPHPRVIQPGHRLVRIRSDVVTGRRLTLA